MKLTKYLSFLVAITAMATATGCGGSESADNCEFEFFSTDAVEISSLGDNSYFKLNKDEDEFDISNLEFVSDDPDIATFAYDKTALGNYIYYNIEPVSGGETEVYVKCKDCGEESEHIKVSVDLPKATEPTEAATEPEESSETEQQTEAATTVDDSKETTDSIMMRAAEDAKTATNEQLQEAVNFLKNNTKSYFTGPDNMVSTMYYGELLENYYKGTGNEYEKVGAQAFKTVKYVYRGEESVMDEVTHNNLLELQEMVENLPNIQ